MVPRVTDDPDERLSGFANPAVPEWITSTITEGFLTPGATDLSASPPLPRLRRPRRLLPPPAAPPATA